MKQIANKQKAKQKLSRLDGSWVDPQMDRGTKISENQRTGRERKRRRKKKKEPTLFSKHNVTRKRTPYEREAQNGGKTPTTTTSCQMGIWWRLGGGGPRYFCASENQNADSRKPFSSSSRIEEFLVKCQKQKQEIFSCLWRNENKKQMKPLFWVCILPLFIVVTNPFKSEMTGDGLAHF